MPGVPLPGYPPVPSRPGATPHGNLVDVETAKAATTTPKYPAPKAPPVYANQDPVGGDHPFTSPAQTKFVQAKLKSMGYNVGIDGVAGPVTVSAYKAYLAGVHPNDWAEAYSAHQHAPAPPANAGVQPHGNPADGVVPPPGPRQTASAAPVITMSNAGLIDPAAFARASANETYNPQIAELARQIAQAKAQEGATQGNIKDWYSRLVGDANSAADANNSDAKAILGSHDTAAAGLVSALGGSASAAAADAGANASIGRTALESLGLSNSGLDRNLGTAYAGEGVTALGDESRQYKADLAAALGKKSDLVGAKGAAYTSALQSAMATRTSQAKTAMDTKVEASLAGVQQKQAAANLKGTQLSNNINEWRYQQGIKNAAAGGTSSTVPPFEKQDPGQLSHLQNNLMNGLLGPKGNFNSDPAQAFDKMAGTLSTLSYGKWDPSTNPSARAFVLGLVNSRLSAWNAQNPQKKYAVQGGQIVRI